MAWSRAALLGFLLVSSPLPKTAAGPLQAGSAKIDITPTAPVTLSGYESRKDLSQGVHDPLSARAIAFERDGQKLVIVSTDIIAYYGTADRMRKAILENCQLQPAELFLAAIHTHSAPAVTFDTQKGHRNNVAYSEQLEHKLVTVVGEALAHLAPAELSFGSGASPIGANRRAVTKDAKGQKKIVLGRNPDLPIDREVQVLKLSRPGEKEVQAALFSFESHSTSLGPRNYLVSGDIHGLAEQFLEHYLGDQVIVAGFAGTSGNIDPWYRVLPGFKTTNGWVPETVLMATLLGEEVAHVLEENPTASPTGSIRTLLKTLELPAKPKAETEVATPLTVPLNITVGCVGEMAFVGFGGEVFNEIGQEVKAHSPFRYTFIMTHCNGAAGYLPAQTSYAGGGYEVESSPFAAGSAEKAALEAEQMLRELRHGN
jgi:neutral ceramidase